MMMEALKELFEEIYSMDFGYPVEGHFGNGTSQDILEKLESFHLPEAYIAFQKTCGHISAMDIHNGYWLDTGQSVIQQFQANPNIHMVSIGSDGGGNLFLLQLPEGTIFKTNSTRTQKQRIAENFQQFLEKLYDDWVHFRDEDQEWTYFSG